MADENTPIDLDALSDDEVNALTPDQIESLMMQEEPVAEEEVTNEPVVEDPTPVDETAGDDDGTPAPEEDPAPEADPDAEVAEEEPVVEQPGSEESAPAAEEGTETAEEDPAPVEEKPEDNPAEEAKDKAKKEDKPKVDDAKVAEATAFYDEITKPFKADGKDFQVKTAAEAIRLMQMGANYSRRMQEMKPLRAQDAVLKGDPAAIQKLLKDKGIDPLDIDVSKDATYDGNKVYSADEKGIAFKDAITATLEADGGKELIADMNAGWDEDSKNALYEQPAIFSTLLDQKSAVDTAGTSDYSKIKAEVERQRVLGFLTDVPFLQAYTQVSNAMENIGGILTSSAPKSTPAAQAPIDTGTRKVAPKPKTEQPNPNLSSNPKPAAKKEAAPTVPDYSDLSDEEFMKLAPPS